MGAARHHAGPIAFTLLRSPRRASTGSAGHPTTVDVAQRGAQSSSASPLHVSPCAGLPTPPQGWGSPPASHKVRRCPIQRMPHADWSRSASLRKAPVCRPDTHTASSSREAWSGSLRSHGRTRHEIALHVVHNHPGVPERHTSHCRRLTGPGIIRARLNRTSASCGKSL